MLYLSPRSFLHTFGITCVAMVFASISAPSSVAASTSSPTPKPTAAPTPKALPKAQIPILFNGRLKTIKGFTIYGTPTPAPTSSPTPQPGAKKTPKPMKFASVETISQIDAYCGGANSGATADFLANGFVALPKRPFPCSQPCRSQMSAATSLLSQCQIIFVRAKDFFKLIGAKVITMVTPPPLPDGALTVLYPTPNPSASPTATPAVAVPTPFQPLAIYYTGSYTVKYCKKLYSAPFFMNKLSADSGKPNIDPIGLINAINADIDTTNLKGISDFKYTISMPPIKAVVSAGKISGSYQPPPSISITGPTSCKAKKKKKHGAYEVEMTSSITTQTHGGDQPATIQARVSADFVLQKASGTAMVLKLPKKFTLPSTNLLATGTGTLTLDSYNWTQTCDTKDGIQLVVADPVNGTGRMSLIGSAKAPILVFDTGLATNSTPSVTATCKGLGGPTGPAIWAAGFNAAHIGSFMVGGLYGGFADVGYAFTLEPSVSLGQKTYTAHYNQSIMAGTTSITESTDFTVTKL